MLEHFLKVAILQFSLVIEQSTFSSFVGLLPSAPTDIAHVYNLYYFSAYRPQKRKSFENFAAFLKCSPELLNI